MIHNLQTMKDNIILLTKNISFITNKQSWSYVFIKLSCLSLFNALNLIRFLFNRIASLECIVVPLVLNVIVYVNFMTFGFNGLAFVICLI